MSTKVEKIVEFKISRFDPESKKHYVSTYKVPIRKGTTILEALLYIKDNLDESLSFRHSCRMGICGSCGVNVNGKPMLACYTQVLHLDADSLLIEPLANMPVIKDLVVDIQPFFDAYKKTKTILIKPEEALQKPTEFIQMPAELKKFWDLTLCTKCSICYSACPAAIDERFLGPAALTANYRFVIDSRDEGCPERLKPMEDNIWLCTQCNSCTLFCPKLVSCANSIVEDHSLLVEAGNIPRTVKDVLESVYKYHNPMATHQSKRMDWAEGLNVKTFPEITSADVLFFVCCSAVYDLRNREVARIMASIFNKMGVNYATLGTEEWCCGDHVLRMGEKGMFEELAQHNIGTFTKLKAEKIVTLSPHCYNTFKNDTPYVDEKLNVQHYTQFLAEAIQQGKIKPSKPVKKKVAYHDPCFLGKRNEIYDAPRQILQAISGLELSEMKRTRESSFCCGGGAGRVWTEEALPEKRPCVDRIKEALELGVDTIAVACPFCVTTLEDAVKVLDVENKIAVKDVLELLREAI
ncbi:MAG: succinate dehydrogenase iron-sulfur subunit [Candidatus Bathyarchaeota archaeon]|nr:succinate dehydrogenase iron-sulfur subunit [Candidatus Bathyarchaeota archaeon]MDH5787803.1 succinate dehydrogenase iron-sulfur subunit [Candidatus Bathyarchaeota archaeon]